MAQFDESHEGMATQGTSSCEQPSKESKHSNVFHNYSMHVEDSKEDIEDLYTNTDLAELEEFKSLVDDTNNSIKWERLSPKEIKPAKYDPNIVTQYTYNGKYNVPVSRSVVELDFNIDFKLYKNQLINDKKVLRKFYLNATNSDVIHEYNPIKRISQFQSDLSYILTWNRDFIVKETGFYIDCNGKVLKNLKQLKKTIEESKTTNYIKDKVVYLIRSIDNDSKYHKQAVKEHVRATMYRCGVWAENISENKSKITVIMEYDAGGSGIVSFFSKKKVQANSSSNDVCKAAKGIVSLLKNSKE